MITYDSNEIERGAEIIFEVREYAGVAFNIHDAGRIIITPHFERPDLRIKSCKQANEQQGKQTFRPHFEAKIIKRQLNEARRQTRDFIEFFIRSFHVNKVRDAQTSDKT